MTLELFSRVLFIVVIWWDDGLCLVASSFLHIIGVHYFTSVLGAVQEKMTLKLFNYIHRCVLVGRFILRSLLVSLSVFLRSFLCLNSKSTAEVWRSR